MRGIGFRSDMLEQIKAGAKCVTRRPMKWPEWLHPVNYPHAAETINEMKCLVSPQDGRVLRFRLSPAEGEILFIKEPRGDVPARYDRESLAEHFIRVESVRVERLTWSSISKAEARFEGFQDPQGFFSVWDELYRREPDLKIDKEPFVKRIEFMYLRRIDLPEIARRR